MEGVKKRKMKVKRRFHFIAILALFVLLAGCGDNHSQTERSVQSGGTEDRLPEDTSSPGAGSFVEQAGGEKASSENSSTVDASSVQNGASGQDAAGTGGTEADLESAKAIALSHAGLAEEEATFVKVELDYDDGVRLYELEFVTKTDKYEYEVKAADGMILKVSSEPIAKIPGNLQTEGLISAEAAKEAALSFAGLTVSDAVCTKIELDYDDGIAVYELEFFAGGAEYEFEVNAATGEVLKMEM